MWCLIKLSYTQWLEGWMHQWKWSSPEAAIALVAPRISRTVGLTGICRSMSTVISLIAILVSDVVTTQLLVAAALETLPSTTFCTPLSQRVEMDLGLRFMWETRMSDGGMTSILKGWAHKIPLASLWWHAWLAHWSAWQLFLVFP